MATSINGLNGHPGDGFLSNVAFIAEQLERNAKRIARLEADLEECREYLDGESDISSEHDEDGSPRPNRAMQLCSMIDETLHGRNF